MYCIFKQIKCGFVLRNNILYSILHIIMSDLNRAYCIVLLYKYLVIKCSTNIH